MNPRILFAVAALVLVTVAGAAAAIEVGQAAPDFSLPSTSGKDISLRQFRSKKLVLVEFYSADFTPT
jgi:peroxiredoxin